SVERDETEPELPLRAVLEEVTPAGVVVLAEPGVPDRQPRRFPRLAERPRLARRREREHEYRPPHRPRHRSPPVSEARLPRIHDAGRIERGLHAADDVHPRDTVLALHQRSQLRADTVTVLHRTARVLRRAAHAVDRRSDAGRGP